MSRRWINLLSIPFLFFSTGLPLLMLRHNCHPKTVQKILLWTPVVPLVIVQVALRAIVLTTLISDSADRVWAVCEALEGWSLLLQVVVFIFMDAMTAPAPKLRIIFAVVLVMRFVESFGKRTLYIYPPEQLGLLPHAGGYLSGLGTSSRQSFVRSIDWTVLAMLGSSIISVLLYPRELAVVRSYALITWVVSPTATCVLTCLLYLLSRRTTDLCLLARCGCAAMSSPTSTGATTTFAAWPCARISATTSSLTL